MRKSPNLQIEEISGQRYPDRKAAQHAAMPQFSDSLKAVIQDLLERGELVNDNGTIKPNRDKHSQGKD